MRLSNMQGFSLIELMIVVVIIGILGSLAIPAYQGYVIRAKVANMMAMAQPIKLSVAEAIIGGETVNIPNIAGHDVVREISVANNIISISGNSDRLGIKPNDQTLKIILTPDVQNQNVIAWKCTSDPEALQKYAPADCRAQ